MQTQGLTNTDILERAPSIGAVTPFHEVSSKYSFLSTIHVVDLRWSRATGRRTMTRPVKSIDRNIRLNRALWTLAEEMKKLKEGQS